MGMYATSDPPLHWEKRDFERMVGFKGAKYTGTNTFLTFGIGLLLALGFYVAIAPLTEHHFAKMFYERGPVPYVIVVLTGWCLAILFVKWLKLRLQRKSLLYSIVPEDSDFVLSPLTADDVIRRLYQLADNPKSFLLLNRIERSLSNLKNIGRVADVDDILRSQAENDETYTDSTYTLMRGFIWAIPVFGFIGTVMGLSVAIGAFGGALAEGSEISELRNSLRGVTGGLAVAFETTLVGLVAAVFVQLLSTTLRKQEEKFLDACTDYCHRYIVSKLRVLSVDEGLQEEAKP